MNKNRLSALPQIEVLLRNEIIEKYIHSLSRPLVAETARAVINELRMTLQRDDLDVPPLDEIIGQLEQKLSLLHKERLQRVVNATGIIVHTNMGRSPILHEVWKEAEEINCGYSSLELNLRTGKRGKRKGLIPRLLSTLLKCEDALVVNNNAAAVLLILQTFAKNREVIVSRGEQVQIGGGFRIPEILEQSGARLVEVGTTNITTCADYERALSEDTSLILSVHRSNFALRGFTSSPSLAELSKIKPDGVVLCMDQGSGVLDENLPGETSVMSHLSSGADLVCFSGDKVFGGPQAGIIAGKKEYIEKLEHHPFMRVFRPGKTVYSLLESILVRKMNGEATAVTEKLARTIDDMKEMGEAIITGMDSEAVSIVHSTCTTGGGTAPDETFPSLSIQLDLDEHPDRILNRLRDALPPVIGTISDDRVHLNLATINEEDMGHVRSEILNILEGQ